MCKPGNWQGFESVQILALIVVGPYKKRMETGSHDCQRTGMVLRLGRTCRAQRLRSLLDFSYATGLRASELVSATLDDIRTDERGAHWLNVAGIGDKAGKVVLPPRALHSSSISSRGVCQ
jgi:integrase